MVAQRKLFVSYSKKDKLFVAELCHALEAAGFSVWWDAALRNGETFSHTIPAQIDAADLALVIWTDNSVASRWVVSEANIADGKSKLFQVVFGAPAVPPPYTTTHYLQGQVGNWQQIIDELLRHLDPNQPRPTPLQPTPPHPTPPQPPEPLPPPSRRGVPWKECAAPALAAVSAFVALCWLPTRYAALREDGVGFTVGDTAYKFPVTWTSAVSLGCAVVVVAGVGWCIRQWARLAWSWPIASAIGAAVLPLVASIGVWDRSVQVVAVSSTPSLVGRRVDIQTKPGGVISAAVCGRAEGCPATSVRASPCEIRSAAQKVCAAEVSEQPDRCDGVWDVVSPIVVQVGPPQGQAIPLLFGKGQRAARASELDWSWLSNHLSVIGKDDLQVATWQGDRLLLGCEAGNEDAPVRAKLKGQSCGSWIATHQARQTGFDILECLRPPELSLEGSCLKLQGPDSAPVKYRLGDSRELAEKGDELCVKPGSRVNLCATLFGASSDALCVSVAVPTTTPRRRSGCTDLQLREMCRRAGASDDINGCIGFLKGIDKSGGDTVKYDNKPVLLTCDPPRAAAKKAAQGSTSCGSGSCP